MISVDVGYGNTKYYMDGTAGCFPSIYKVYNGNSYNPRTPEDMLLELDGQKYLIGETALNKDGEASFEKESLLRHQLFVLASICKATENYKGNITVGLPIGDMQKLSPMLLKLKGKYEVKFNGSDRAIDIQKVKVLAQGEAIIHLLKAEVPVSDEVIGIIDIGQKTVDFAWFRYGSYVEERSGSVNFGMYNAWTEIASSMARNFGIEEPEQYMVRKDLERFRRTKRKGIEAVEEDVRFNLKELAQSIRNRLLSRHWNFNELDRLYVVGGGAYLLREFFSDAPLQEFDHPEHANSIAFYEG